MAIPLLGALLACLMLVSLGMGPVSVEPSRVAAILLGADSSLSELSSSAAITDAEFIIVRTIRPPRVLLAVLIGALLALSGAVMQGLFQNPMADPYVVGVSSGAALGATIALSLSLEIWVWGIHSVSLFAFVGALAVTMLVYGISVRGGKVAVPVLLLTGVALGSLAAALTSFLMLMSEQNLHRILYWLLGGLASRRWEHVEMVWPYAVVGVIVLQVHARDLNLLLQGEESAQHLGVNVERVKLLLLGTTALLTAAAVAVSGIVGFVGLLVPHMMRLLVGPDHRRLFPASALGGAILVVGADILARTLIAPAEIPLGVITSLLGCPFFLFLLHRRRL